MPEPSRTATAPRIRIERLLDEADRKSALYDETFWSLRETPRSLPAVWLYDERGSRLFEEITRLPEYYLTGAEREILVERSGEIAAATAAATLVELGSGTSEKTTFLLDALAAAETLERFVPVDVSEEVLRASAHAVADRYPRVGVHAIVGDFERHLAAVPAGGPRLVAFLGSTIGNLRPDRRARLLATIASTLEPGDSFLLGIDLVKDPARLEAAYNDGGGVTESFVRNGLTVVNRELRASFDQRLVAFSAFWDAEHEWMDIGFRVCSAHTVRVDELESVVPLAEGERLRLEVSTKFRREAVARELADVGLRLTAWWTDDRGDFALLLADRAPGADGDAGLEGASRL
jgi:L-histidine N-alpha-methyltransferase